MSLDKLMKQNLEFLEKIRSQSPLKAFEIKDSAFAETERQRRIKASEANIEGLSQRREALLRSINDALEAEKAEIERLQKVTSFGSETEIIDKSDERTKAQSKKRK